MIGPRCRLGAVGAVGAAAIAAWALAGGAGLLVTEGRARGQSPAQAPPGAAAGSGDGTGGQPAPPGPRSPPPTTSPSVSAAIDGRGGAGGPGADRVVVPAGPFVRGSARGGEDERPVRRQTLPAFRIDRTEVTRRAYAACVRARRCRAVPAPLAGPAGADGTLPVTGVSWLDARDFCAFARGRLPTEAEWEKAARGTDGREYPWGDDAACARANWGNFEGEGPCAGGNPGFPVAVGRYPDGASPYGVLDLAGNVWEWVADRYDDDPKRRVVRGGSCCSYFVPPRAPNRNAWSPDHRDADLGFRCVAVRG